MISAQALSINAVYPGVLYLLASGRNDVDAIAAIVDVTLDLTYFVGWGLVMRQFVRYSLIFPIDLFGGLGMLTPCLHLLFVCRAVRVRAEIGLVLTSKRGPDLHTGRGGGEDAS